MDDWLCADGCYDRSRTPETWQEKALEGVPVVGFDNKEKNVFRVRPISSNDFDAFGI